MRAAWIQLFTTKVTELYLASLLSYKKQGHNLTSEMFRRSMKIMNAENGLPDYNMQIDVEKAMVTFVQRDTKRTANQSGTQKIEASRSRVSAKQQTRKDISSSIMNTYDTDW
jgi:hypothetical protein